MVFSPKNCLVDIILGYDINKLYSSHPVIEILVKVYIVLIFKVILLGIKVFLVVSCGLLMTYFIN